MRKALLSILPLIIIFLTYSLAYAQMTPRNLNMIVYEDGVVQVEYSVNVDPTYPAVNISLYGQTFEDLIVTDEDSIPLSYSLSGKIITVNTLGASLVKITYVTPDITNKVGKYWTLNFTSPVIVRIILPRGASIISLNSIPELIESRDGRTEIIMPKGPVEITYVLGIVGTKEHSWATILSAEKTIEGLKAMNIIVDKAESLLRQAKEKFYMGNYVQAEELARQAEETALQINETARKASSMILQAEEAIAKAENEGKDVSEAKTLLNQAKSEFDLGNYELALSLAGEAKDKAEKAKPIMTLPYLEISLLATIVIGITIALIAFKKSSKYKKEVRRVDLDKIFKERPELRLEDKEVIKFLAEVGGEAFESEIREKFKLPRTTIWRMVKRLEREELVEVKKVGGQNLIRIKNKFCE